MWHCYFILSSCERLMIYLNSLQMTSIYSQRPTEYLESFGKSKGSHNKERDAFMLSLLLGLPKRTDYYIQGGFAYRWGCHVLEVERVGVHVHRGTWRCIKFTSSQGQAPLVVQCLCGEHSYSFAWREGHNQMHWRFHSCSLLWDAQIAAAAFRTEKTLFQIGEGLSS